MLENYWDYILIGSILVLFIVIPGIVLFFDLRKGREEFVKRDSKRLEIIESYYTFLRSTFLDENEYKESRQRKVWEEANVGEYMIERDHKDLYEVVDINRAKGTITLRSEKTIPYTELEEYVAFFREKTDEEFLADLSKKMVHEQTTRFHP